MSDERVHMTLDDWVARNAPLEGDLLLQMDIEAAESQGPPANGSREEAGSCVGSPPGADTICVWFLSFLFLFGSGLTCPGSAVLSAADEGPP